MRLLGIDYGEKRVGIAVSDESGKFAFPWGIFANNKRLPQRIGDICKSEGVKKIVLGESRTYTGEKNPIMKKIEFFKERLEAATGLPVVFEPETLTSREARRGREERERPIDDSAAAIILQSFIDKQTNL